MSRSNVATWRIVGGLVAVVIVLALAVPAVAQMLRHTAVAEHELPAGLARLAVRADVGEIRVGVVAPGEQPRAVSTSRASFSDPAIDVTHSGDTISLGSDCTGPGWLDPCEVQWDVLVPAGTDVDLQTSVGEIHVAAISGELRARTSVGNVVVTDSGSPVLNLQSSVGDLNVHSLVAPDSVTALTSVGEIRVILPGDGTAYRLDAETSIGDTTNQVGDDRDASRVLTLQTSIGDIFVLRD